MKKILLSVVAVFGLSLVTVYAFNVSEERTNNGEYTYPCETCYRTGKCRSCRGSGKDRVHTIQGTVTIDCGACNGTGVCKYCGGDGIKGN